MEVSWSCSPMTVNEGMRGSSMRYLQHTTQCSRNTLVRFVKRLLTKAWFSSSRTGTFMLKAMCKTWGRTKLISYMELHLKFVERMPIPIQVTLLFCCCSGPILVSCSIFTYVYEKIVECSVFTIRDDILKFIGFSCVNNYYLNFFLLSKKISIGYSIIIK